MKTNNYIALIGGSVEADSAMAEIKKYYKLIIFDQKTNPSIKKHANIFVEISSYDYKKIIIYLKKKSFKQISAVINIATDNTYSTAKIASNLNVNYQPIKIARMTTNKLLQKKFFNKIGVKTPKYFVISKKTDLRKNFFKKTILKPIDNRGARGVLLYQEKKNYDYFSILKNNSKNRLFLAEEFIEGKQFSVECIIDDNQITIYPISLRNYSTTKHLYPFIIEDGGEMPFKLNINLIYKLQILISNLVKNLGNFYGALKLDLILNNEEFYIIEFASRLSGGYLSTFDIKKVTGDNIIKRYINSIIKEKIGVKQKSDDREIIDFNLSDPKNYLFTRYLIPKKNTKISSFFIPKMKGVKTFGIKLKKNIAYNKPTSHAERYGRITSFSANKISAKTNLKIFLSKVMIYEL